MPLKGKTLFITGASRGIGLAIALRAARDGANIAIAAKTETPHPKLEGTIYTAAEEIEKAGGKALPLPCDIRDEQSVEKSVADTVAKFGGIDPPLPCRTKADQDRRRQNHTQGDGNGAYRKCRAVHHTRRAVSDNNRVTP